MLGVLIVKYIPKRQIILLSLVANIVGMLITILSTSLYVAGLGLFINFAAKSIQTDIIVCIIT